MIKFLYIGLMALFINTTLVAQNTAGVDCIILEDENSIVCKYTHTRVSYEKNVTFNWIEPNGQITRTKELTIPAGHGSIYDYRYIKGRTHGVWTFVVVDGESEFKTNFTIGK